MNKVVGLLTLCVLFAVLKAAVVALVVAMIVALLWSFITQPRETLLLLGTLGLMGLATAQPLACIIAIGVFGVAVVLAGRTQKRRSGRLLTGNGESPHRTG